MVIGGNEGGWERNAYDEQCEKASMHEITFGFDDKTPEVYTQLTAGLTLGRESSHLAPESGAADAKWLLSDGDDGDGNSLRLVRGLGLPVLVLSLASVSKLSLGRRSSGDGRDDPHPISPAHLSIY